MCAIYCQHHHEANINVSNDNFCQKGSTENEAEKAFISFCNRRSYDDKRENVSRISTPNGISTSVGSLPFGKKETHLESRGLINENFSFWIENKGRTFIS